MLYPFYIQSYCTSILSALEIYFIEKEAFGKGFETYLDLIDRTEEGLSYLEELEAAGLTSPFEKDFLKTIADKIHFELLGYHYYYNKLKGYAA
jgi:hypothetical protein